jgi:hypothetical protein
MKEELPPLNAEAKASLVLFVQKLSRDEEPTGKEFDSVEAVLLRIPLPKLRAKRDRDSVRDFFSAPPAIKWLRKNRENFEEGNDDITLQVLRRFRDYLNAEKKKENKHIIENQPWFDERFPVDKDGKPIIGLTPSEKHILELSRPDRGGEADRQRLDKESLAGTWRLIRKLQRGRKELDLFIHILRRRIEKDVERQHDPELQREYEWQTKDAVKEIIKSALIRKEEPEKGK